jgi:SAM-dependent methyltransferase
MPRHEFYAHLAMSEDSVLDAGCGAGELLSLLRERGHSGRLVGLARDEAQLVDLRARTDAEWRRGPLPVAGFSREFALVVMTGDTAAEVGAEAAAREFLAAAREALRPDGRLVFDVPNPLVAQRPGLHAEQLDHLIGRARLVVHERYGDWDRSPFTPTSPQIITVAAAA